MDEASDNRRTRNNPTLTIVFKTDITIGNYITIEPLQQTKPREIKETKANYLPTVQTLQYASYIFLAVALSATGFTAFKYLKLKPTLPPKLEKTLEEIIEPPSRTAMTTIRMATMEDLARISEALVKPILHTTKLATPPNKGITRIFYIIDNDTKYQYVSHLETVEPGGSWKGGRIFKGKGLKWGRRKRG